MERLRERLELANQALRTFREALSAPLTPMNRDASIQRFEYTHEAVWKAAQLYLRTVEKLELASPAAVTRACAIEIYARLPKYVELMEQWLAALSAKAGEEA